MVSFCKIYSYLGKVFALNRKIFSELQDFCLNFSVGTIFELLFSVSVFIEQKKAIICHYFLVMFMYVPDF